MYLCGEFYLIFFWSKCMQTNLKQQFIYSFGEVVLVYIDFDFKEF